MLVQQEPDVIFTPDPQTEATCSLAASFGGSIRSASTKDGTKDGTSTVGAHFAVLR